MYSADTPRRNSRRRPELNINTSPQSNRHHRDVIPQTPPSRKPPVSGKLKPTASARALRTASQASQATRDGPDIESFLDSITPVDLSNKENDRPEPCLPNSRDSHDLSLPPRQVTRDSLVTNMLLSLDQFSMDQLQFGGSSRPTYDDPSGYSSFGGDDFSTSMTYNSKSGRNNGHGYTYSSDLEAADDSSRMSSQQSRGRRSNSSSGFQSSLGRINSLREPSHQRSIPGTPRPLHSRGGGKGSKSSSTNSIDAGYAQVLGSQRWAAQGFGRSSSFDRVPNKLSPNKPSPNTQSPWQLEFSNSFLNDEYDAAPTPTVPGGPRRLATVPSLPVLPPPPEPPQPSPGKGPGLERKRSTRSSRSATVGRKHESKNITRDVPPLPTFDLDSAPAPHVGYEKSKEPVPASPNSASHHTLREKPSFFRRMFGSSKSNSTSPLPQSSSSPYVSSPSRDGSASRSQQHIPSQMKSPSAPPSRDSHHPTTPHVLQKKTSSFFRRRKYSLTEPEPPLPPPPVIIPPVTFPQSNEMLSPKPDPSPITSLRRAMDPFLKGSPTTPNALSPGFAPSPLTREPTTQAPSPRESQRKGDEDQRNVRGFSPDYEPSPKAVIRAVEADNPIEATPGQQPVDTPTRHPPDPPGMGRSGSFFNDNSDSESSPQRQRVKESRDESDGRELRPVNNLDKRASSASMRGTSSASMRGAKAPMDQTEAKVAVAKTESQAPPDQSDTGRRRGSTLALPIEGIMADDSQSVSSSKPADSDSTPRTAGELKTSKSIDEPDFVVGDPTEDDRQKAQRIYDGNEDFIQKEKAAAWMGEEGPIRQRTLRAYMDLYDFKNKSIVDSLRLVCARLVLRAETQQVDRILVAFATQWCDCNPNHGFKTTGLCFPASPFIW